MPHEYRTNVPRTPGEIWDELRLEFAYMSHDIRAMFRWQNWDFLAHATVAWRSHHGRATIAQMSCNSRTPTVRDNWEIGTIYIYNIYMRPLPSSNHIVSWETSKRVPDWVLQWCGSCALAEQDGGITGECWPSLIVQCSVTCQRCTHRHCVWPNCSSALIGACGCDHIFVKICVMCFRNDGKVKGMMGKWKDCIEGHYSEQERKRTDNAGFTIWTMSFFCFVISGLKYCESIYIILHG